MKFEPTPTTKENRNESIANLMIDPPVIESFFNEEQAKRVWPEKIAVSEEFKEQIEKRKEMIKNVETVIDSLPRPDASLESAISEGRISEVQVQEMYASLSELLESEDYKRILLYLPFELLPDENWEPSQELKKSIERFKKAYMAAWEELFKVYDIRANFVDGDVLEAEIREDDVPRVVKSTHLIPKLIEKGMLETEDAIQILEKSNDETLRNSIADTFPILADLGLLGEKEIERMEKSQDRLVTAMARIIVSYQKTESPTIKPEKEDITFASIQKKLNDEFSNIDSADYDDMTENRKVWIKQKKKQEKIEESGNIISLAILNNQPEKEVIDSFFAPPADSKSQQALSEGIRKTIESVAENNFEKAKELYAQHKEILLNLWKNDENREIISKTFRRLKQLNVVSAEELEGLSISIPNLSGPFSKNLELMNEELNDVKKMVSAIESNPELSKMIYPLVLVSGSRLKGYGEKSADIDLGIFVRPGTSFEDRTTLKRLLKENFSHEKIHGEPIEFWLEEKEGALSIRNFEKPDISLGQSYLTYFLFCAAWEGKQKTIRELNEKLLVPYLYETDKMIEGHKAHSLYLEKMEQEVLQYRLLHKGYERFFPPYGGIHTEHSDEIDGNSMFWDSGYRQLATKLFLKQVFLPKIHKE